MPPRDALIKLLRLAYSGELAAAYAYRGHWRSLADPDERESVRKIELEEWEHRRLVGAMLARLGATPSWSRELLMTAIGRLLQALCHVTGWLLPMYGAARLETRNVKEYDDAARFAAESGHGDFVPCLSRMADVELEHERYFKERLHSHRLGRLLPLPACTRHGEIQEVAITAPRM